MCRRNRAGGFQGPTMSKLTVSLDKIQLDIGGPDETVTKIVLWYFKGSLHVGITSGGDDDLIGKTDARWAGDQEPHRSRGGYGKTREEDFPALRIYQHPRGLQWQIVSYLPYESRWALASTSKHYLNSRLEILNSDKKDFPALPINQHPL